MILFFQANQENPNSKQTTTPNKMIRNEANAPEGSSMGFFPFILERIRMRLINNQVVKIISSVPPIDNVRPIKWAFLTIAVPLTILEL